MSEWSDTDDEAAVDPPLPQTKAMPSPTILPVSSSTRTVKPSAPNDHESPLMAAVVVKVIEPQEETTTTAVAKPISDLDSKAKYGVDSDNESSWSDSEDDEGKVEESGKSMPGKGEGAVLSQPSADHTTSTETVPAAVEDPVVPTVTRQVSEESLWSEEDDEDIELAARPAHLNNASDDKKKSNPSGNNTVEEMIVVKSETPLFAEQTQSLAASSANGANAATGDHLETAKDIDRSSNLMTDHVSPSPEDLKVNIPL